MYDLIDPRYCKQQRLMAEAQIRYNIDAMINSGAGRWVKDEDMNPLTNISGRRYRVNGGPILTYRHLDGLRPSYDGLEWYFTPEQCGDKL